MDTGTLSPKKLDELNPLIYELLVGQKLDLPSIPIDILLGLGGNLVNFLSLLLCNQYLNKGSKISNVQSYLVELFVDLRGLDSNLAVSILHEGDLIDSDKFIVRDPIVLRNKIEEWVKIRRDIRHIKSPKVLTIKYRSLVIPLVEYFYSLVEGFVGPTWVNENAFVREGQKTSIPLFPFFVIEKCPQCSQKHLFAFQLYNVKSEKLRYKCWGNEHSLFVDRSFGKMLKGLESKGIDIDNIASLPHHSRPLWPLFNSYLPAMGQLANLLFEQTKKNTQKKLWLTAVGNPDLHNDENFVKNKILLECIEKGPVAVIRDVGQIEGKNELPGYVEILLKNEKSKEEIRDEILELEKRCKKIFKERFGLPGIPLPKIDGDDPEFIQIKNEVYSLKVVELFGFKIEEIDNVSYVEYYRNKLIKSIEFYSRPQWESASFDLRVVSLKLFYELESVYKELVHFYRYLYDSRVDKSAKQNAGSGSIETLFSLDKAMRNLHKEFSMMDQQKFRKLLGNGNDPHSEKCIFDMLRYERVLRINDEKGNLFDLQRALYDEEVVNYYLQEDSREALIAIFDWVKNIYDFLLDSKKRIFPYKIIFTVSSEIRPFSDSDKTLRGIKTCQYFTYLENGTSVGEKLPMKIYTDQAINFSSWYYCLPHPDQSRDNIWVDPMLIPIDAIGFTPSNPEIEFIGNSIVEFKQDKPFIFISYSHADKEKVRQDVEFLKKSKYSFFWDEEIRAGAQWDDDLCEKIHRCSCFVVYLSEASMRKSSFVHKEIARAYNQGKRIIPILLEEEAKDDAPIKLEGLHYLKKYDTSKKMSYFTELIEALGEECLIK